MDYLIKGTDEKDCNNRGVCCVTMIPVKENMECEKYQDFNKISFVEPRIEYKNNINKMSDNLLIDILKNEFKKRCAVD